MRAWYAVRWRFCDWPKRGRISAARSSVYRWQAAYREAGLKGLRTGRRGWEVGVFRDPFGHRWNISHSIEEVSPEEMQRCHTELLKATQLFVRLVRLGSVHDTVVQQGYGPVVGLRTGLSMKLGRPSI